MYDQSNLISDQFVSIKVVCATLDRSKASIYRDIKNGVFPAPIKHGKSSRWLASDLNKMLKRKP